MVPQDRDNAANDPARAVDAGAHDSWDDARRQTSNARRETAEQESSPPPFRRILIGVDDSTSSEWAVEVGRRLVTDESVTVALAHVIDTSKAFSQEYELALATYLEQMRPAARDLLARSAARFAPAVVPEQIVCEGAPAAELVGAAGRWSADLIVVGTHSHGRLATLLLGSTAHGVARRAACPVLTVGHPPADATPRSGPTPLRGIRGSLVCLDSSTVPLRIPPTRLRAKPQTG